MKLIKYVVLFFILSFGALSHSESTNSTSLSEPKSPLQICAEKKLKEFRKRTMVSTSDEPFYLDKFKQECAKEKMVANQEQQIIDARKNAEKDKKVAASTSKPTSADQSSASSKPVFGPVAGPTASSSGAQSASSSGSRAVIGGCGTQEQCEAYMAEMSKPRYRWSSPGLMAYLGELWGNRFDYAHLEGQFEQPQNACNEKNIGELIAFDTGTDVKPIACMSDHASQEEIKKMAEKIKNVKVETLPVVVAVKRPVYEWKVIVQEAKLEEGQIRICTGPGACGNGLVGNEFDGGPGCAKLKCIRIDGGPVKSAKKDDKKDDKNPSPQANSQDKPKNSNEPSLAAPPSIPQERVPAQLDPQQIPQDYKGYDFERDGAAGP